MSEGLSSGLRLLVTIVVVLAISSFAIGITTLALRSAESRSVQVDGVLDEVVNASYRNYDNKEITGQEVINLITSRTDLGFIVLNKTGSTAVDTRHISMYNKPVALEDNSLFVTLSNNPIPGETERFKGSISECPYDASGVIPSGSCAVSANLKNKYMRDVVLIHDKKMSECVLPYSRYVAYLVMEGKSVVAMLLREE